jgi:subtilisin family serine protease
VAAIEPNARSVRPEPVHDQSDENEESEESELGPLGGDSPQAIEASLTQIGAPAVWALGFRGAGVVIGGQDTGVEWTHPALKAKYRGWNGAVADHDYHWHDAIHEGAGSCGVDTAAPCDDNDHGTHTIGTMLGDDGGSNKIGVAPGSRWIACKNMQETVGTVATYSECFQWFVAPTDLAGENPDPARAPHVINNSWSCPPSEGCTMPNVLRTVVQNTRAAGIVVVVSAGNTGQSGCGTVETPAAIYDASFTVGAVDAADEITDFSSRGPVTVDGSNRLKPDLAAPGQSIRSAIRFGNYGQLSGTSMAGPHVAGAVALLLSADPFLLGDVDEIEEVLRETAFLPTGGDPLHQKQKDWCGGISPFLFPNHTFGAGRVDALAAVESRFAGGLIFRDNFELAGAGRWTDIQ